MERLGLQGALVLEVLPNSPAEKAGLRPTARDETGQIRLGDIIVAVDGQEIESADDFAAELEEKAVGTVVRLRLRRGQQELEIPVTLAPLE
jgi:S1-C subfamily serine protease